MAAAMAEIAGRWVAAMKQTARPVSSTGRNMISREGPGSSSCTGELARIRASPASGRRRSRLAEAAAKAASTSHPSRSVRIRRS